MELAGVNGTVLLNAGSSVSQFLSIYDGASLLWHIDTSGNVRPAGNVDLAAGMYLQTGGSSGAVIVSGTGAPTTPVYPNGSLYQRIDGTTGTRWYVSTGSAWTPVAGV